ncbi:mandelate racemase/muconate lactonizing enzyme family protein [Truepera radiovictrix]|uniref:Mandelate racemase/muconate lactonizing protein n=1 Tax=Truepera radiovictrix (strain DSM 17093 / CIP 108686 / LMG 22925 / RQ-24) TaxID=649638 RepID=D7CQG9_TRURR|nr:enolase C-terminal domain-like protein [Truepera radiovictrix]ADI14953.1 Mandelate racemase/muconate lactonizing protein [Truepera radiovictrix DSM 17093]WMT56492.1 enolase C-terminal domain-like protein [Truepera radiovictrix]
MSAIVRVDVGRYDYAVAGSFKFLKPGRDGVVRRPSVLVRLTDDEGFSGWGQAVPMPTWCYETPETVETTLRLYLAEALLGADPEDLEDVHARMNRAIRPAFSVGQPLCKAALDLACFDLVGKRRGVSAAELLGGAKRSSLTLSWTVASADLEAAERQLEAGRARGYRNFNIKVGAPQSAAYDLELARTVRTASPDGFVWADANTAYSEAEALKLAPKLADAGVDVLESPLPPTQLRGYQRLKAQGALPILMDEGVLSPVELREFIALEMLDGVALKPARNAGLWPSKGIVEALWQCGLMVLGSGLTDPDFALAAAVQLYSWAGIAYPCALNGPQFLADSLGDAFAQQGDQLLLPTEPGLGFVVYEPVAELLETVAEV